MRYALLIFALCGCAQQPMTPEQQASQRLQSYCALQAQAAREGLVAQQDQSRDPSGFGRSFSQSAVQSTAYNAAFERCMMETKKN